jgi:hypothetical protein
MTGQKILSHRLTLTPEVSSKLEDVIAARAKNLNLSPWHPKLQNQGPAFPTTDLHQGLKWLRDDINVWFSYERTFQGPGDGWYVVGAGIKDNFNESDSATTMGKTDSGQSWIPKTGTWGISTNKAYSVTDAVGDLVLVDSGITDPVIQCTLNGTLNSVVNFRVPQLGFRGLDSSNFLLADMVNGTVRLLKFDGGVFTTLTTTATTTSDNTDYQVCIVCNNLSITIYVNGVSKITYTLAGGDTKYVEYTKMGFRLAKGGAPATAARWDALLVRQAA